MTRKSIYIDAANLHIESKKANFNINYKKFGVWLRQKYNSPEIYLFIGFISINLNLYERLESFGYTLIFKETSKNLKSEIKGNCDAEMVLKICQDFYEEKVNKFILVTNDGDFSCVVNFLLNKNKDVLILSPNKKHCSFLLKKTKVKITDLTEHRHKFSSLLK